VDLSTRGFQDPNPHVITRVEPEAQLGRFDPMDRPCEKNRHLTFNPGSKGEVSSPPILNSRHRHHPLDWHLSSGMLTAHPQIMRGLRKQFGFIQCPRPKTGTASTVFSRLG